MDSQDAVPDELKAQLFKRVAETYERCLWPFDDCPRAPSQAHSIQNARVLDLLHRDNHVVMPRQKILLETGPQIAFQSVSRHKASTFTGLCNAHDSDLFRLIDTETVDTGNPEQLFLIAYRSVIKEYHATLASAQSIQGFLVDAAKAGTIDPKEQSPAMVLATGRIVDSYETYLYWTKLNDILADADYGRLNHTVISLPSTRPCLAVSAVFPLEIHRKKTEAPPSLILNVHPEADGTHTAILSHLPEHGEWAATILPRIDQASGHHLLYEISKLILERAENFVLSPAVYSGFSDSKRQTLLTYFSGNLSGAGLRLEMDSPELMMFV